MTCPEDADSSSELPYLGGRRGSGTSVASGKVSRAESKRGSSQGVARVRSVLRKRGSVHVKGKKEADVPPVPPMPEFLVGMLGSTVSLPAAPGLKGMRRSNTVSGRRTHPGNEEPSRSQAPARASSPPTPEAAYTLNRFRQSRTLEDLPLDSTGSPISSSGSDPWTFILNPSLDTNIRKGVLASTCNLPSPEELAKLSKRDLEDSFDEWEGLSGAQVWRAAQMEVVDTDGKKVRFGSLFEGQRTICCFIRHFW